MVVIGILYLVFEDFVLSDFVWSKSSSSTKNHTSRMLVGVQTGLTLLAIVVTRSSALSLQAKKGLPLGNQVVGWIILGEFLNPTPSPSSLTNLSQSHRSSCPWPTASNPTTTTCTESSSFS